MKLHIFRLMPGQDLKQELIAYVEEHGIQAGFILACVGSLQRAALRLADRSETTFHEDKFEIVSLTGTIELGGSHLHISLSDGTGTTIGGHLQEESLVYTTAEIVLGEAPGLVFARKHDEHSGYPELVIRLR